MDAINSLLEDHICLKFSSQLLSEMKRIMSPFWCEDSGHAVARKLADKERYD
jgi:hypothetical protein